MKNLTFKIACVVFFLLAGFQLATAQSVPGTTNIQINLAESGLPVNGNKTVSVSFGTYSTGNQTVTFTNGLGTISVNLPLETLKNSPTTQLQVSVNGVNVSTITPETVPYSKVALFAYEAQSLVNFPLANTAPQNGNVLIWQNGMWTAGTIQAGQIYTADGTTITLANNQFALNTAYTDGRYVNEGQANSVTSAMVTDGSLQTVDFIPGILPVTTNLNLILGHEAGLYNTPGIPNSYSGKENTFLGEGAGKYNNVGNDNTFIGYLAGYDNTSGRYNVFVGSQSGNWNETGIMNVFIGRGSGLRNSSGSHNVFIGDHSADYNTTGEDNVIIGYLAGGDNIAGQQNVYIGSQAGSGDFSGNIHIGTGAGMNTWRSNTLVIDNSTTASPLIYGEFDNNLIKINGSLQVTGTKNFIQDHPTDLTKQIVYVCLEGGEAGTYQRGSGQLVNGVAEIALPEHFSLVTNSDEGLTAIVSPRGNCNGLYVEQITTSKIVVRELNNGTSNVCFDFIVNGIRIGYENHEVIQSKN